MIRQLFSDVRITRCLYLIEVYFRRNTADTVFHLRRVVNLKELITKEKVKNSEESLQLV